MKLANEKIKYNSCNPQVLKDFSNLTEMSKIKTIDELEDFLSWHNYIVDINIDCEHNELIVGLNNFYWWFVYSFKEKLITLK